MKKGVFEIFQLLGIIFKSLGYPSISENIDSYNRGDLLEGELLEILRKFSVEEEEGSLVVEIQGCFYLLDKIVSLEREERYSFSKNRQQYLLVMNRTDSSNKNIYYGNTFFVFDTKEEREKVLKLVKNQLSAIGYKFV